MRLDFYKSNQEYVGLGSQRLKKHAVSKDIRLMLYYQPRTFQDFGTLFARLGYVYLGNYCLNLSVHQQHIFYQSIYSLLLDEFDQVPHVIVYFLYWLYESSLIRIEVSLDQMNALIAYCAKCHLDQFADPIICLKKLFQSNAFLIIAVQESSLEVVYPDANLEQMNQEYEALKQQLDVTSILQTVNQRRELFDEPLADLDPIDFSMIPALEQQYKQQDSDGDF